MKPMLASDWDENKVKFPVIMQPKIDGVRAMNMGFGLTGRSLKPHANVHTTNFFSQTPFRFLDGEMAAEYECNPSLCRLTTSALNTITGEPWILWHVFDYLDPSIAHLGYANRLQALEAYVASVKVNAPALGIHLRVIPWEVVHTMDRLQELREQHKEMGYEGSCFRKADGPHKQGRSTVREGGLLRIKDFTEREFRIDSIEEGQTNLNEATVAPNGYTERSTHQENMVPNGMVGAFLGRDLETDQPIKVAAGKLPHDLRKLYFEQPQLVLGKIGKYKTFLHGVKDKPRFPTFQTLRAESDMS